MCVNALVKVSQISILFNYRMQVLLTHLPHVDSAVVGLQWHRLPQPNHQDAHAGQAGSRRRHAGELLCSAHLHAITQPAHHGQVVTLFGSQSLPQKHRNYRQCEHTLLSPCEEPSEFSWPKSGCQLWFCHLFNKTECPTLVCFQSPFGRGNVFGKLRHFYTDIWTGNMTGCISDDIMDQVAAAANNHIFDHGGAALDSSDVFSFSDIRSTQGYSTPSSGRASPAACPRTWTLCPRGSARPATPPTWLASGTWASTGEVSSQVAAWGCDSQWETMKSIPEVKPVLYHVIMMCGSPPTDGAVTPTWPWVALHLNYVLIGDGPDGVFFSPLCREDCKWFSNENNVCSDLVVVCFMLWPSCYCPPEALWPPEEI